MKLETVYLNAGALQSAQGMRLKNGAVGYRFYKELSRLIEELKKFDKFKSEIILATGKETIQNTDVEYPDVLKKIQEALSVEIEDPQTVLHEADLENVEIDISTIRALVELKLLG